MKKFTIGITLMIFVGLVSTVKIDNIDAKYLHLNIVRDICNNFKVSTDLDVELEVVDEYILAMEGFLC